MVEPPLPARVKDVVGDWIDWLFPASAVGGWGLMKSFSFWQPINKPTTKIVEAIAYGTTVISTETGAAGMVKEVCGEKLIILKDNDWSNFIELLINNNYLEAPTPNLYYKTYFWKNIIESIINI